MKDKVEHTSEWWYSLSVKVIGYPFLIVTFLFFLMLVIVDKLETDDFIERFQYPLFGIVIGTIMVSLILSVIFSVKGSRTELKEKEGKDEENHES